MEEEKIAKQKPHTSFNRRLFVAKNPEGNMTTAKKNFILQGGDDKGGIWQRVLRYMIVIRSKEVNSKLSLLRRIKYFRIQMGLHVF